MTNGTDNLVREHLRYLRGRIDEMHAELRDVKFRTTTLESGQASILGAIAGVQSRLDRQDDRLERIARRLELVDGSTPVK